MGCVISITETKKYQSSFRNTDSGAGGTGSSNDIVIFYTADHDLSSIHRDEESEFLIEDNGSRYE